jgi:valyl-tRNA synthetase
MEFDESKLRHEDRWILQMVNEGVKYVTEQLDKFELGLAGQKVYELIWDVYCDWYIEMVKSRLYGDDEEDKRIARYVLTKVLKDLLKFLHPFMPFITEEIWGVLPHEDGKTGRDAMLIRAEWPEYTEALNFPAETEKLEMAMSIIKAIRNIRAEAEAAPSKKLSAVILCGDGREDVVRAGERYIEKLANITQITFIRDKKDVPEETMSAVVDGAEVYIPLDELMDYGAELDRLTKEKKRLEGEVKRAAGKLNNEGFVSKAPAKVVEEEKAKKEMYEDMLAKVADRLAIVEAKLK